MPSITWDSIDSRRILTGVDRGVLYPGSGIGLPWNGLTSINETPSDYNSGSTFYDGSKIFITQTKEYFSGTIEAYTYPRELMPYIGESTFPDNQDDKTFDLSYRAIKKDGFSDKEYHLIHLVYNVVLHPSQKNYQSLSDSNSPTSFSWDFVTNQSKIGKYTGSHMIVDTETANPQAIQELEDILYGTDTTLPRLPSPEEIIELFESKATLRIYDNGDGTWTANGPDSAIKMLTSTKFEISWPSAIFITPTTYMISSL